MSNTMMTCILVIYLIVLAAIMWYNHRMTKTARDSVIMVKNVIDNANSMVALSVAAQRRDIEIAKLFAGVLFDLTHATDKNVLQWKLSMLKNIDFLMNLTGYETVYDDNFYNWMIKSLTTIPKNAQVEQLNGIRNAVKGYYIMDPDIGTNFCDMIADIISLNGNIDEAAENYKRTYKALIDAIKNTDIEFLIADMTRTEDDTLSPRERLFESLNKMQETCAEAENMVKEFEKECESKDEPNEPEETPEPSQEDNSEPVMVPAEGDSVIQGEEIETHEEIDPPVVEETPVVVVEPPTPVSTEASPRRGVEFVVGEKKK